MTALSPGVATTGTSDIEQTACDIKIAQWGIASVVMAASGLSGWHLFAHLDEPGLFGLATALAVDLNLAVWIRISARLRALDITSRWGRALEIMTLIMTLYLNVGVALVQPITAHTWPAIAILGVAHSFVPVTLILLSFACGDAHHKMQQARQAEQRQLAAVRAAEIQRQDHAVAMALRGQELAAQERERELAEQQQVRAHEAHQTAALLASQAVLGASLQARRPAPRRRPPARPVTSRAQPLRAVPSPRPRAGPAAPERINEITPERFAELLAETRVLRDERAKQGLLTGRRVLTKPRDEGGLNVSDPVARKLLDALDNPSPLHSIAAGNPR